MACTYAPQLNQATVGQGLPYVRLVRGKEILVRLFFSLPASVPRCAGATPAIKVNSATLTVRNKSDNSNILRNSIPAQQEAIGALITAPAPTKTRPAIPADAPADPKFAVGGLAPSSTLEFTASFAGTIKFQSRASDGSFAPEVTQTFGSFTPPGGVSTPIEKVVEKQTRNIRLLTVPMKVTPTAATASALARGMDNFSRIWPAQDGTAVPDGTPAGPRTGALTGTTGGLRYSINPGVVDLTGQLDSDGRWCGTGTNFTTAVTGRSSPQGQLLGFKNAWNGVVNGVDTPAEQDADRVIGFVGPQDSVPSAEAHTPQCLEGYAIVNTDAAFGRVSEGTSAMTGPVFVQEVAHLFGAVAGTGTYHSLYTESDNQDPNLAYNVMTRAQLPTDRTAMKLVLPWDNGNTGLEKDHFAYLLCGEGGLNTAGCPSAPATGTFTGVAAGDADVIYGVTNDTAPYTEANTNSLQSSSACCTTPDPDSPYRFVQLDADGDVLEDEGVPVRSLASNHHGEEAEIDEGPGSFDFATKPAVGATKFQLRLRDLSGDTVLYERGQSAAPVLNQPTVAPSGSPAQYTTGSGDELEPAVSQDGEWLAWMETDVVDCTGGDCGPPMNMVSVAPSADEETYVRLGVESQEPSWRPDGGALAYVADGDIYTIPVTVSGDTASFGTPTKIHDGGDPIEGLGASHPTWSPDGAMVAFAEDDNIWKVPAAGGTAVKLTTTNDASEPSWSQSAGDDRIAYVRRVATPGSGETTRVSISSEGAQSNGQSSWADVSADGRYVAFHSRASSLVEGDTNGVFDIFVHDRELAKTVRVSVSSAGVQADGASFNPAISADGRFVAFQTQATNLGGDLDAREEVFVHDRDADANGVFDEPGEISTVRMSVNDSGTDGTGFHADISATGRFVTFASGSRLAPGDSTFADVFVRDRDTDADGIFDEPGETQIETVSVTRTGAPANGSSQAPSINDNGAFIAFRSTASNLIDISADVPNDTNGVEDIFVRDRDLDGPGVDTATTLKASTSGTGGEADGASPAFFRPTISGEGRYVAFDSFATNLAASDTNEDADVFVRDLKDRVTERVSLDDADMQADGQSLRPSISLDGRFVAFDSNAVLVSGDTNGGSDVFVRDRLLDATEIVSVDNDGTPRSGVYASISADDRYIAFESANAQLVEGDTNSQIDIFLRDREGGSGGSEPASIYTLDPANPSTTQLELIDNATEPSWGSGGLVGFVRDGDVWTVAGDGSNPSKLAEDGRRPSLDTNVIAFDRFIPDAVEGGQFDIFLIRPSDEQQVTFTGTDDNPAQTRTTIFFECGESRPYPMAVDLHPTTYDEETGAFTVEYDFDSSATCGTSSGEGTLIAVTHDGYATSTPEQTTVASEPKPPVPAISGLSVENRQWEGITATGTAVDQDGNNVPGTQLRWESPDGLFAGFKFGNVVELKPPAATGWDTGTTNSGRQYTLELAVVDGAGNPISEIVTATTTILPDKDHDGMTGGKESQSCFKTGDLDPFNAFSDYDGDGDWNVSDPRACTADPPPSTAEFTPDPLVIPSTGATVSMKIRVLNRNIAQVLSSSVRLKTIDGVDVSTNDTFRNVRWTVNADGTATALFDKQALIQWLVDHGVENRRFKIEVMGRSAAPAWDFTAADDVYAQTG